MTLRSDALASVTREELIARTQDLVNIASPTGGEAPLAHYLAEALEPVATDASVQPVGVGAANAWASTGQVGGPSVLLYSPIDTVTTGDEHQDTPWANQVLRPDMAAVASQEHGWVVGLGAQNPKGHAACVLVAFEALARSGAHERLTGQVLAGFGCLGMPANRRQPQLLDGHGHGCTQLITLLEPTAALIAKSGRAVSWTEVGLLWFTVEVFGTHTYVGSRHLLPYRSAIADAAHIISAIEAWFPTWASEHGDDLNTPQGIVGSVAGGHDWVTAFTPQMCSFTIDLRISPDTDPDEAERVVVEQIRAAASERNATFTVKRTVTIPGSFTPQSEPIVQAAVAAWEKRSGRPHEPTRGLSGATDANILRSMGVPTARIGLPKVAAPGVEVDFQYGMNAVNPDDQVELTKHLIESTLNYFEAVA